MPALAGARSTGWSTRSWSAPEDAESARGDHTEDSDLDLAVVLADPVEPWTELRAMREVLGRHLDRSFVVVSALPVAESAWRDPVDPVLIRASAEAVRIA